ncbi:MAG: DSD1 family PLP-dependent enzyme [Burkholderiaceae bacterium]
MNSTAPTFADFSNPNQVLLNQAGGVTQLMTPCLVVDLPAMERNIDKMAGLARARQVDLRPHAKTHKCLEIARRQLAGGAVGMCTATLGEAAPLLAGGIEDILITSPAIGPGKPERLLQLRQQSEQIKIVIDSPDNLNTLAALMKHAGLVLQVMVGLDIGAHRIGARTVDEALALARAAKAATHLELVGVFAYAGTLQHIADYAERQLAVASANQRIERLVAAIRGLGVSDLIVSGGGTGSSAIDLGAGVYSELQVGSYLLMDIEYGAVDLSDAAEQPFEQSLWVMTRVIGANHPGFVTTDAGTKRFSMGGLSPVVCGGPADGAEYFFQGDEHGLIRLADVPNDAPSSQSPVLPLETLVRVRPPHCDPTVNLYDRIHVIDGDRLVDIWAVEGRGAV